MVQDDDGPEKSRIEWLEDQLLDRENAVADLMAPKPWWQSRTIVGAGIAGGSVLGGIAFGFSLDGETQRVLADQTTAFLVAGGALAGTVITIIGRFKASRPVSLTKPKD